MAKNRENILTCVEAAVLMNCTSDYVRRCCRSGKLKAFKASQAWLIYEKDFNDFMIERNSKNGTECQ